MKEDIRIHVYCMPGLAANPTIFEHIHLPEDRYVIHWLDWLLPNPLESLEQYAKRMCKRITHNNVVLIGVSFGGVLVQEMTRYIDVKRLIIISSAKCRQELPRRMRYADYTGLFKVLPTGLARHVDLLDYVAFWSYAKKRVKLYKKYLSITDTNYLDWAIEQMVCWRREKPVEGVVHIHGDKDEIFPYKYIRDCITVPGGTHVMIINRFRWFNEHLEEIILTGQLKKAEV